MLDLHVLDKDLDEGKLLGLIHILIEIESPKLGQVCLERGCGKGEKRV